MRKIIFHIKSKKEYRNLDSAISNKKQISYKKISSKYMQQFPYSVEIVVEDKYIIKTLLQIQNNTSAIAFMIVPSPDEFTGFVSFYSNDFIKYINKEGENKNVDK